MNLLFPPNLDIWSLTGFALLILAALVFAFPRMLAGNRAGRLIIGLRWPIVAVGAVLSISAFLAQTPETRLPNPIPATVESVAVGEGVYLNDCASCHGADALGGGPLADTTPVRPPALTGPGSHLGDHTDGDLHWVIANGRPGGMPAWAGTLTDDEIWSVINYLRSLN
jgi:mono/diheme cytochrome c family protein